MASTDFWQSKVKQMSDLRFGQAVLEFFSGRNQSQLSSFARESPLGAPKPPRKHFFNFNLCKQFCDICSPASRENPWFVHFSGTVLQASRCAATKRRNNLAMNWVKQIFIEYLVMFSVFLTKSSYDKWIFICLV